MRDFGAVTGTSCGDLYHDQGTHVNRGHRGVGAGANAVQAGLATARLGRCPVIDITDSRAVSVAYMMKFYKFVAVFLFFFFLSS